MAVVPPTIKIEISARTQNDERLLQEGWKSDSVRFRLTMKREKTIKLVQDKYIDKKFPASRYYRVELYHVSNTAVKLTSECAFEKLLSLQDGRQGGDYYCLKLLYAVVVPNTNHLSLEALADIPRPAVPPVVRRPGAGPSGSLLQSNSSRNPFSVRSSIVGSETRQQQSVPRSIRPPPNQQNQSASSSSSKAPPVVHQKSVVPKKNPQKLCIVPGCKERAYVGPSKKHLVCRHHVNTPIAAECIEKKVTEEAESEDPFAWMHQQRTNPVPDLPADSAEFDFQQESLQSTRPASAAREREKRPRKKTVTNKKIEPIEPPSFLNGDLAAGFRAKVEEMQSASSKDRPQKRKLSDKPEEVAPQEGGLVAIQDRPTSNKRGFVSDDPVPKKRQRATRVPKAKSKSKPDGNTRKRAAPKQSSRPKRAKVDSGTNDADEQSMGIVPIKPKAKPKARSRKRAAAKNKPQKPKWPRPRFHDMREDAIQVPDHPILECVCCGHLRRIGAPADVSLEDARFLFESCKALSPDRFLCSFLGGVECWSYFDGSGLTDGEDANCRSIDPDIEFESHCAVDGDAILLDEILTILTDFPNNRCPVEELRKKLIDPQPAGRGLQALVTAATKGKMNFKSKLESFCHVLEVANDDNSAPVVGIRVNARNQDWVIRESTRKEREEGKHEPGPIWTVSNDSINTLPGPFQTGGKTHQPLNRVTGRYKVSRKDENQKFPIMLGTEEELTLGDPLLALENNNQLLALEDKKSDSTPPAPPRRRQSVGHPDLAATSSDDGTARIWDLRTCKSVRRLKFPTVASTSDDDDFVGSIRFNPDGLRVYAGVSSILHQFDLRTTSDVIVKAPSASATLDDTVNEFDVSSDGKWISVPQDNGHISILDATSLEESRVLAHSNSNAKNEEFGGDAVSVAMWRPGVSQVDELVSAGYDMAICRWAGMSGVRRKRLLATSILAQRDDEKDRSCQVFNPPYVLSAKFDQTGSNLVAGLGDGSLLWWQYHSRDQVRWDRPHVWQGHRSALPGLAWLDKNRLLTFGNDRRLLLWNLDRENVSDCTRSPVHSVMLKDTPNALDVEPSKKIILAATTANEATILKVV
eukprot:gene54-42_t